LFERLKIMAYGYSLCSRIILETGVSFLNCRATAAALVSQHDCKLLGQTRLLSHSQRRFTDNDDKKTNNASDPASHPDLKQTAAAAATVSHESGIDFSRAKKNDHDPDRSKFFKRVLDRFPGGGGGVHDDVDQDGNRCLSLAYGSGVFQQANSSSGESAAKNNMTDFIFVVENSQKWHQQNLQLNPTDYSGLMRRFGPKVISDVQEKYGAHFYFNTLIPFEEGQIKYGVISRQDFISDLLDWDTLYAAGRLQKPVRILEKPNKLDDQELELALRMNLTSAMHTALLLLPDRFSEEQLFTALTALSYAGDFRMSTVGGEDKNKVRNIVRGSMPHFQALYSKRIHKMKQFVHRYPDSDEFEQDVSPAGRHHHLTMLPKAIQMTLVDHWNKDLRSRDLEDVLRAAAFERDSGDIIYDCVKIIVKGPSISQAAKGILSAGAYKSVVYSYAKIKKWANSIKIMDYDESTTSKMRN